MFLFFLLKIVEWWQTYPTDMLQYTNDILFQFSNLLL